MIQIVSNKYPMTACQLNVESNDREIYYTPWILELQPVAEPWLTVGETIKAHCEFLERHKIYLSAISLIAERGIFYFINKTSRDSYADFLTKKGFHVIKFHDSQCIVKFAEGDHQKVMNIIRDQHPLLWKNKI